MGLPSQTLERPGAETPYGVRGLAIRAHLALGALLGIALIQQLDAKSDSYAIEEELGQETHSTAWELTVSEAGSQRPGQTLVQFGLGPRHAAGAGEPPRCLGFARAAMAACSARTATCWDWSR